MLTDATGDAPRLLLFTLRALAYLKCPLDSNEAINDAIYDMVYPMFNNDIGISLEFMPGNEASTAVYFSYLLALSLAGPLSKTSIVAKEFAVGKAMMSVAWCH